MAEGGKEDEKDNPFSFKSFVSKKDKKKDDDTRTKEDDELDIFDISENTAQRKREKPRQTLLVEDGTLDCNMFSRHVKFLHECLYQLSMRF